MHTNDEKNLFLYFYLTYLVNLLRKHRIYSASSEKIHGMRSIHARINGSFTISRIIPLPSLYLRFSLNPRHAWKLRIFSVSIQCSSPPYWEITPSKRVFPVRLTFLPDRLHERKQRVLAMTAPPPFPMNENSGITVGFSVTPASFALAQSQVRKYR